MTIRSKAILPPQKKHQLQTIIDFQMNWNLIKIRISNRQAISRGFTKNIRFTSKLKRTERICVWYLCRSRFSDCQKYWQKKWFDFEVFMWIWWSEERITISWWSKMNNKMFNIYWHQWRRENYHICFLFIIFGKLWEF